jgi:hypothetical protein
VSDTRWLERAGLLLLVSSALYFLGDNEADNDLWVHLFSGTLILAAGPPHVDTLSYTAAGAAWVDHEWLTQAAFAWIHGRAGSPGLWLAKLGIGLLTAWLVWLPVARRAQSPWARGLAMLLALAVLSRGFAVRPQVVSYLGVAALLAWLDREPRPRWPALAVVALAFCVWANAHGAFIMGLLILALYALPLPNPKQDQAPRLDAFRLALPLAGLLGASLTPYGPGLFAYILDELRAPHPLTEWQPVELGDPGHLSFLLMLAALALTLPFARALRRQPWRAVLIAGVAFMAFRHQRHTPLFALCAAAPLAEQLEGLLAWLARRRPIALSAAALKLIAAGIGALVLVQQASLVHRQLRGGAPGRIVYDAAEYPAGALRYIREHGVNGNLALPLDWGGYALWHAAPHIRVSMDGRFATVYPPAVVETNFAFFRADGDPGAARLLDAHDTTLVLMPRGFPTPVQGSQEWTLLYTDEVAALYGRDGTPARAPSTAPRGWLPFP